MPLTHIPLEELIALVRQVFIRHGMSEPVASIIARNCCEAERDSAESHGLFRINGYLNTLKSGWVDGRAVPRVDDRAPGFLSIDAANGFAQPALAAARDLAIARARQNGICAIAIHNSHHFAALWPDVEPFAAEGLVALTVVNSMAVVVPHGARKPVYGTNPIAFAAPREGAYPLVFDQATSTMAHGDVKIAAREGHAVPAGTGVDASGAPTTDPKAILTGGALNTFGGYKGAAISMMIEILGAALTGGKFSFEVDWSRHPGAETPHTGQFLILIDPSKGPAPRGPFAHRVEQLIQALHTAGQARLPGERRFAAREKAVRDGVPVKADKLEELRKLGE